MAIVKTNEKRTASAKYVVGVNDEGNEIHKTRSVASFKTSADLESVNETVLAISSLGKFVVKEVILTEKSELEEI